MDELGDYGSNLVFSYPIRVRLVLCRVGSFSRLVSGRLDQDVFNDLVVSRPITPARSQGYLWQFRADYAIVLSLGGVRVAIDLRDRTGNGLVTGFR